MTEGRKEKQREKRGRNRERKGRIGGREEKYLYSLECNY